MSLRGADRPGARIAIVGGGLSGLYAAWLLAQRGIRDWVLFEARSTLGGRILSIPVAGSDDGSATAAPAARSRFDLGPAWFWPSIQGDLSRLIDTLGLARFAQFESGDMMYERTTDEPPVRVRGLVSSPVGMRLAGGTASLIDALHGQLERERILCQTAVRTIRQAGDRLELDSRHASGGTATWNAKHGRPSRAARFGRAHGALEGPSDRHCERMVGALSRLPCRSCRRRPARGRARPGRSAVCRRPSGRVNHTLRTQWPVGRVAQARAASEFIKLTTLAIAELLRPSPAPASAIPGVGARLCASELLSLQNGNHHARLERHAHRA